MKRRIEFAAGGFLLSTTLVLVALYGTSIMLNRNIVHHIHSISPDSTGISASVPISQIPSDLISPRIRSAHIDIQDFRLKNSGITPQLSIDASLVSKSTPFTVQSLDVTATISAAVLDAMSGFTSSQVVGNALEVTVGANGLGKALLVPKFSGNELYFALQSFSLLGSEIPASSLPAAIQDQIKSKSLRKLSFPKGLSMTGVKLSSKGLVVQLHGSNFSLANLNTSQ